MADHFSMRVDAFLRNSAGEESSQGKISKVRSSYLQYVAITALSLIAIAIRLTPMLRGSVDFAIFPGDSDQYLQLAAGMREGCGFAQLVGGICQPAEIMRTPGYPLMLAALPGIRLPVVAQCALTGVLCWLLGFWVRREWNLNAALAAQAMVAFDLPSLTATNLILSDALFQFVLFLAVVSALIVAAGEDRHRKSLIHVILAASAAGFAAMTRPIAVILPLVMAVPFLFAPHFSARRRVAFAVIAFLIPTLTMAGWSARNYRMAHYPGLSTVPAINLYFYRAANVIAREQGITLEAAQESFGKSLGVTLHQMLNARRQPPDIARRVQSQEIARKMTEIGTSVMRTHIPEVLSMTLQGTLYMAVFPDRSSLARVFGVTGGYMEPQTGLGSGTPSVGRFKSELDRTLESPLLVALLVFQLLLSAFVWLGVIRAVARLFNTGAEYHLWILYLVGVSMLFIMLAAGGEASVRFRTPVVPLLAIVAGLGYFPGFGRRSAKKCYI